jgi:hypothetical protein
VVYFLSVVVDLVTECRPVTSYFKATVFYILPGNTWLCFIIPADKLNIKHSHNSFIYECSECKFSTHVIENYLLKLQHTVKCINTSDLMFKAILLGFVHYITFCVKITVFQKWLLVPSSGGDGAKKEIEHTSKM